MRMIIAAIMMLAMTLSSAVQAAQASPEPRSLRPFIEGVVYQKMDDGLPSAIMVAYVHGDEEYAGAYGTIRPDDDTPADETSLFRFGSITKLLVWVSVMQQVEAGRLDLDTDINEYLTAFRIPDTFDEPITLRHIMAHRSGFEDTNVHFVDRREGLTRAQTVERQMPTRVAAPGARLSYSNYATELAAHLVENVSGTSFENYVAQNVFTPLGMGSATFSRPDSDYPAPLDPGLDARTVRPVKMTAGERTEARMTARGTNVAMGGLAMDARDALAFLRAFKDQNVLLSPESWAAMTKAPQGFVSGNTHSDFVLGLAHGAHAGYRYFGHGGRNSFSAAMVIFPELDLAVIVSANTQTGRANDVYDMPAMVARYIAGVAPGDVVGLASVEGGASIAGQYLTTRRSFTRVDKFGLMGSVATISMTGEGDALISHSRQQFKARHVGGDRWQSVTPGTETTLVVERDAEGSVTRIRGLFGAATAEPIERWQGPTSFYRVLAIVGLLSITTLLGAWYRRGRKTASTELGRKIRFVPVIAAAVWLVLLGLFALLQLRIGSGAEEATYPSLVSQVAINWALVAVLVGIAHILVAILAWFGSGWSLWRKLHASLYALALAAMIAILDFWHAFGRPFLDVT